MIFLIFFSPQRVEQYSKVEFFFTWPAHLSSLFHYSNMFTLGYKILTYMLSIWKKVLKPIFLILCHIKPSLCGFYYCIITYLFCVPFTLNIKNFCIACVYKRSSMFLRLWNEIRVDSFAFLKFRKTWNCPKQVNSSFDSLAKLRKKYEHSITYVLNRFAKLKRIRNTKKYFSRPFIS